MNELMRAIEGEQRGDFGLDLKHLGEFSDADVRELGIDGLEFLLETLEQVDFMRLKVGKDACRALAADLFRIPVVSGLPDIFPHVDRFMIALMLTHGRRCPTALMRLEQAYQVMEAIYGGRVDTAGARMKSAWEGYGVLKNFGLLNGEFLREMANGVVLGYVRPLPEGEGRLGEIIEVMNTTVADMEGAFAEDWEEGDILFARPGLPHMRMVANAAEILSGGNPLMFAPIMTGRGGHNG